MFLRRSIQFAYACIALLGLLSAIPESAIPLHARIHPILVQVFPQGWGFFTKNPRESSLLGFHVPLSGEPVVLTVNNSSPGMLGGIRKTNRLTNIELTSLLKSVDSSAWRDCKRSRAECVKLAGSGRVQSLQVIRNPAPHPTVCGTTVLLREGSRVWAWDVAKLSYDVSRKTVVVAVRCAD